MAPARRSRVRGRNAGNDFERGGLARSVGTGQPDYFAPLQLERNFVQDFRGAVTETNLAEINNA
jgi:hypothetical protein